jgi:hypothetical protein
MSNQPQPQPNPSSQERHQSPANRGSARKRRENGLYLPLWSILLMLLSVCGITVGVVWLVLSNGASNQSGERVNEQGTMIAPTQPEPLIIISSPVGMETLISPMTATIP